MCLPSLGSQEISFVDKITNQDPAFGTFAQIFAVVGVVCPIIIMYFALAFVCSIFSTGITSFPVFFGPRIP